MRQLFVDLMVMSSFCWSHGFCGRSCLFHMRLTISRATIFISDCINDCSCSCIILTAYLFLFFWFLWSRFSGLWVMHVKNHFLNWYEKPSVYIHMQNHLQLLNLESLSRNWNMREALNNGNCSEPCDIFGWNDASSKCYFCQYSHRLHGHILFAMLTRRLPCWLISRPI